MAIPLLNETPKYHLVIPSTGKKIKYRPYLVKEEKILMIANETKDRETILEAIVDTIQACTDNKIKVKDLTTFDLEFIFLKLRAKSVGENITLQLPCSVEECKTKNEAVVNLDDVQCPISNTMDRLIELNDSVTVEMKYPNYNQIENSEENVGTNVILSCISSIIIDEEKILAQDEPLEELQKFLESMTREQFNKISNWVLKLPQVEYTIKYSCTACGEHNEIEVKGLENFF
jgi:hypothetical protein